MLLTERIAHAVAAGDVSLAYRRWRTARVVPGAKFHTVAGVVRVDAVTIVSLDALTDADARRAGFDTVQDVERTFRGRASDPVFRIVLSWAGPDERDALAEATVLSAAEIASISALLDRLDRTTPWARIVLGTLDRAPGTTAAVLASLVGLDKDALKRRIRTLKAHGLTRSLRVGYELSSRGHSYLRALETESSSAD